MNYYELLYFSIYLGVTIIYIYIICVYIYNYIYIYPTIGVGGLRMFTSIPCSASYCLDQLLDDGQDPTYSYHVDIIDVMS